MKLNQRTTLWGAILAVLLIFLALRLDVPPVVIVLLIVVAALVGLVVYSRRRDDEAEEGWDEGDEWGLQADDADDDMVDLDDRLSGLGLSDDRLRVDEDEEVEYDLFAEDEGVVYEEETVYGGETVYGADTVYEDDAPSGVAVYGAAAAVDEEPYVVDEELSDEAFEEEFEGLVEEYEEVEETEEVEASAADYDIDEESILAAEGVIDEQKVKSDEAILAASQASSLKYDDVLQREDANAETREILSRVASLLAKYE